MTDVGYFGRPLALPPPAIVRSEHRSCAGCGLPIQPGQLYAVAGPMHIACSHPAGSAR